MTTDNTTPDNPRPIGYWLRTVDHLITRAFDAAFADEPVDRRDWMTLNRIDGTVDAPLHPRAAKRVARLARLGWVARTEDGWALTASGREAKDRLGAKVADIRARVAAAAPAEDLSATLRTLEAIARELGWHEGDEIPDPEPRGRTGRIGWGGPVPFDARLPHPRRPFGAHGAEHPAHHDAGPAGEHPHRRHGRRAERAFERGFLAGFARGRSGTAGPEAS